MSGVNEHLLADLPANVRERLSAPPVMEKKFLELMVTWNDLSAGQSRIAELLRLFVITWDPLEGRQPRPDVFATANGGEGDLDEVVVYMPVWSLFDRATKNGLTLAGELPAISGAVVVEAARVSLIAMAMRAAGGDPEAGHDPVQRTSEALANLSFSVDATQSESEQTPDLGTATIELISPNWEDIGLAVITDIAQHALGPVDFDRSPVELAINAVPQPGCPACAGRRFDFPGDLIEAQSGMCARHESEAVAVVNRRFARANQSNPDSWHAILGASARLGQPHLPHGLAGKLVAASDSLATDPAGDAMASLVGHVVDAAQWFAGRPNDFAVALGEEPADVVTFPDWLEGLISTLGMDDRLDDAVRVADALSQVDPDQPGHYYGQATIAFAEAGEMDEAHTRIDEGVSRWPDDVWTRLHAGEALAVLGDDEGAQAHFRAAMDMASQSGMPDVAELIQDRMVATSPRMRKKTTVTRHQPRRKPSRSRRRRH